MSVETRGPRAFNALIESLVEAGQMDLAEKLGYTSSNISARSAEAATGHKELPGPFGQPRTQHQCTTGIGRFYFKKKQILHIPFTIIASKTRKYYWNIFYITLCFFSSVISVYLVQFMNGVSKEKLRAKLQKSRTFSVMCASERYLKV